jgi:hypothetical protein
MGEKYTDKNSGLKEINREKNLTLFNTLTLPLIQRALPYYAANY